MMTAATFPDGAPSAGSTAAHSGGEKNPTPEEGRSHEVSANKVWDLSTADVFRMFNIITTAGKLISQFWSQFE